MGTAPKPPVRRDVAQIACAACAVLGIILGWLVSKTAGLSFCLIWIFSAIGSAAVGALLMHREMEVWKIRWIVSEHDLARLEKRQPRAPENYDNDD